MSASAGTQGAALGYGLVGLSGRLYIDIPSRAKLEYMSPHEKDYYMVAMVKYHAEPLPSLQGERLRIVSLRLWTFSSGLNILFTVETRMLNIGTVLPERGYVKDIDKMVI